MLRTRGEAGNSSVMSSVEDERQSTEDSEKQLSDSGESPRQQTADDQDDEDLEKKRGKRADRKLRESALDDSGQFETKAPMESLANSLEYLQEILEQLNSLRYFQFFQFLRKFSVSGFSGRRLADTENFRGN